MMKTEQIESQLYRTLQSIILPSMASSRKQLSGNAEWPYISNTVQEVIYLTTLLTGVNYYVSYDTESHRIRIYKEDDDGNFLGYVEEGLYGHTSKDDKKPKTTRIDDRKDGEMVQGNT